MKLTNNQLYQMVQEFNSLTSDNSIYIPAKANFFIQKNISLLAAAAQEIETERMKIAQHYGELNEEENNYKIPEDKMSIVAKELNDLFSIEQEFDIKKIKIEDLGDAQFTSAQMKVLMLMIDDE